MNETIKLCKGSGFFYCKKFPEGQKGNLRRPTILRAYTPTGFSFFDLFKNKTSPETFRPKLTIVIFFIIFLFGSANSVFARNFTASYYSVESCKREGTWQKYGGKMANKEVLNDNRKTAASWFYPFGTRLKVSRLDKKGKALSSVNVVVTDRGPAKSLVRKGRVIDLSLAAMRSLNGIEQGVISVRIEKL